MSVVSNFNKQEYLENISNMSNPQFMEEWNKVTAIFHEKFKDDCKLLKVVKICRERRTSTGRRFTYGKVE